MAQTMAEIVGEFWKTESTIRTILSDALPPDHFYMGRLAPDQVRGRKTQLRIAAGLLAVHSAYPGIRLPAGVEGGVAWTTLMLLSCAYITPGGLTLGPQGGIDFPRPDGRG